MARKNTIWCSEKDLSKDLSGKTYIVTGANSGIGLETTRQLIKQGGHVVMACLRISEAEEVTPSFKELKGTYEVMKCDLSNLESVRDFVGTFKDKHKRLDGLMCNAGMVNMEGKPKYTKDGFEITWAINFFGHFLMTEMLLDTLKDSAPSRIGFLSSVVHAGKPKKRHTLHLDDLRYKNRKYNNFDVYSEAKLACVLYAKELSQRLEGSGVATASIHPGWARSNFGKGEGIFMQTIVKVIRLFTYHMTDSNWASAQTSLHVLLSDEAPKHSGAYFSQSSSLYRDKKCKKGGWPMKSPNPHAHDMELAKQLVEKSYELVGLK